MRDDTEPTEAGREYAAAYAAHYADRDFARALRLYRKVMASHPNTREADYSWTQVQNIVNAVVPKQELLDTEMKLALAHLEHHASLDAVRILVTPLASELPTQRGYGVMLL